MALKNLKERMATEVSEGARGKTEVRRSFLGLATRTDDTPTTILNSSLVPKVGQQDPLAPGSFVTSRNAKRFDQDDVGLDWIVEYTSSTAFEEEDEVAPTNRPADIEWSSEQIDWWTILNRKKKQIRTTAGSLYPMKVEQSRWVISVEKNVSKVPADILNYNNTLNEGTFTIDGIRFEKEKLMIKQIKIGRIIRETWKGQRIQYRRFAYNLYFRPEGWKTKEVNADFVQLVGKYRWKRSRYADNNRPWLIARDNQGRPQIEIVKRWREKIMIGEPKDYPTNPWPLDKNGVALKENYDLTDLTYIEEDVYPVMNFNGLPR